MSASVVQVRWEWIDGSRDGSIAPITPQRQTHLPLATGELHVHEATSVCESLLGAALTVWLLAWRFRVIWDEVGIVIA